MRERTVRHHVEEILSGGGREIALLFAQKREQNTVQNTIIKRVLKASTFSAFRDVWIVFRHSCLKYVRICRCVLLRRCVTCMYVEGDF